MRTLIWINSRILSVVFIVILFLTGTSTDAKVVSGLEQLLGDQLELIQGKRLGIVANQTSRDAEGRHIVDLLAEHADIAVLFALEHGFMGNIEAGGRVGTSSLGEIKIFSLYGETREPTPEMLQGVDVLIYDVQDVGVKFYTYISSLYYLLRAAGKADLPVLVMDRPNPIDAVRVEGAITQAEFSSFVGIIPIPVRYGMTIGELAQMMNREEFHGKRINARLRVIPMRGYERAMVFSETGLPWVPTSPNIPTPETALIYPGTCLFEGSNLSEGRGTEAPFLTMGAPFIDAGDWLEAIPAEVRKGCTLTTTQFTPQNIPGKAVNPKYEGQLCNGLRIEIFDHQVLQPIELAIAMLSAAKRLYPDEVKFTSFLDKLWGNRQLRIMLNEKKSYAQILEQGIHETEDFKKIREKYLIYP